MFIKNLLSRLTQKSVKIESDVLQEIMLFSDEIIKEYSLKGFVEIQLKDEMPINNGRVIFENNIWIAQIGVKGCRNLKELASGDWITLKNTILHELTHVKNKIEMTQDTLKKLNEKDLSLACFAMKLIDEYVAYRTADERFEQLIIGSKENEVQRALKPFWSNKYFIQNSGLNGAERYDQLYDIFTAIIVHSTRNANFPSIPEDYNGYNEMCKRVITIVDKYSIEMPLDYEKYEEAGKELWDALLIIVPKHLVGNFKRNTGLKFL